MLKSSWTLLSLFWVLVHPVISQPVRPPQWVKTRELKDAQSQGVWKVFEKTDTDSQPKLPPVRPSQTPSPAREKQNNTTTERKQPGRQYKRESGSNKSIVSVLVPVAAPDEEPVHREHNHAHDVQYITHGESKHIVAMKTNNPENPGMITWGDSTGSDGQGIQSYPSPSASTYPTISNHSISLFSYRISFPFLKFAPVPFPQLPLPGIFTAVMVVLALVWVAILAIGLIEVGNYLWQRRRIAQVMAETDRIMEENPSGRPGPYVKVPLHMVPGAETADTSADEDSVLSSASESDSEPEVEDYRFF